MSHHWEITTKTKKMLMHFLTAVLTVVIPEINAQEDNEPLIFRIPDGTKENSYIGNLPQNANLDSPSNAYLRKFVIVAGDNLIKVSFYHIIHMFWIGSGWSKNFRKN